MGVKWNNKKSLKEIRNDERRQHIADEILDEMVNERLAHMMTQSNVPPSPVDAETVTSEDNTEEEK